MEREVEDCWDVKEGQRERVAEWSGCELGRRQWREEWDGTNANPDVDVRKHKSVTTVDVRLDIILECDE